MRTRLLLAFLLGLCCCGGAPGTVIVVQITGARDGTQTLRATSYLNGKREQEPVDLAAAETQVVIRLPVGAAGLYSLDVDGLGDDQCSLAVGRGELEIAGERHLEMTVTLRALLVRTCSLAVSKSGPGEGWVESDPPAIRCGTGSGSPEVCFAPFQEDSTVRLLAHPRDNASFDGWSDSCSGFGSCMVTMGRPASVAATFGVRAAF